MKMRNKGKVHPSPSSSSSSSSSSITASSSRDALSILKLLPAAILALASVLCLQDREVLAYMVTRSLKTTTTTPSASFSKRNSKKLIPHEPPIFDCDCFDCYRSYWFRWDSSPNRELIHQAIEAFEEHLSNGEQSKKTTRNKKKEKTTRRNGIVKPTLHSPPPQVVETALPEVVEDSFVHVFPEVEVSISLPVLLPVQESTDLSSESGGESEVEELAAVKDVVAAADLPETAVLVARGSATNSHKGLARKVLPDVLGLFNSRLWSLWSPNM